MKLHHYPLAISRLLWYCCCCVWLVSSSNKVAVVQGFLPRLHHRHVVVSSSSVSTPTGNLKKNASFSSTTSRGTTTLNGSGAGGGSDGDAPTVDAKSGSSHPKQQQQQQPSANTRKRHKTTTPPNKQNNHKNGSSGTPPPSRKKMHPYSYQGNTKNNNTPQKYQQQQRQRQRQTQIGQAVRAEQLLHKSTHIPGSIPWNTSLLSILQKWARLGEGSEAERVCADFLTTTTTTSGIHQQNDNNDFWIQCHQYVLHAWTNQVSQSWKEARSNDSKRMTNRRGSSGSGIRGRKGTNWTSNQISNLKELQEASERANQVLTMLEEKAMSMILSEDNGDDDITTTTAATPSPPLLLKINDYAFVIFSHTKSQQTIQAVQVLERLEHNLLSLQKKAASSSSLLPIYMAVIKSLANCRISPDEWQQSFSDSSSPADMATSILKRFAAQLEPKTSGTNAKNDPKQDLLDLYNAVLQAWSKQLPPPPVSKAEYFVWIESQQRSQQEEIAQGAKNVYEEMLEQHVQPNAATYTNLIYTYCKCGVLDEALVVWEELRDYLLKAPKSQERVDSRCFKLLVNSLARKSSELSRTNSTSTENPVVFAEQASSVIDGMWKLKQAGYRDAAPSVYLYTTCITSWADAQAPESAEQARSLFEELQQYHRQTSQTSLAPDVTAYNALVNAIAKQPNVSDAVEQAGSIVKQMESEAFRNSNPRVLPDTTTYNTLIDACLAMEKQRSNDGSTTTDNGGITKAEQTLRWMLEESKSGNTRIQPAARSYASIIRALATSKDQGTTEKAETLLDRMEERFTPSASLYEDVIFAWCRDSATLIAKKEGEGTEGGSSNSEAKDNTKRAQLLLQRMENLYSATGNQAMRPNVSLYKAVREAWEGLGDQGDEEGEAENVRFAQDQMHPQSRTSSGQVERKPISSISDVLSIFEELNTAEKNVKRPANTWTFNLLLSLLAKSGKPWAGQRAEDVLDYMLESYNKYGNHQIKPDIISFNKVMDAWSRTSHPDAATKAEAILRRLKSLHEMGLLEEVQADRVSFNTVISAFTRSSQNKGQDAERIFKELVDLFEASSEERFRPDIVSYTSLLNAWARNGNPTGAKRAEEILLQMQKDYKEDASHTKPNTVCFNTVIRAWAIRPNEGGSKRAEMLLRLMEDMFIAGNDDVQPDTRTYNIVLHALANGQDEEDFVKAQLLLEHMHEEHRNGNAIVKPDTVSFNTMVMAITKHCGRDSLEALENLLQDVYQNDDIEPGTAFFSNLINALSRTSEKGAVWLAEDIVEDIKDMNRNGTVWLAEGIIEDMRNRFENGTLSVKPDVTVYNALLNCWAKSGEKTMAARRAQDILEYMQIKYEAGDSDLKPNVQSYTLVLDALAKSRLKNATETAEGILEYMQECHRRGDSSLRPNAHTYTALIQNYARSELPFKAVEAQSVLNRMKADFEAGNVGARPNAIVYNAVLNACEYSYGNDKVMQEAFRVACTTLDELRASTYIKPNHVSYGTFLGVCSELMPKSDVRNEMVELIFRRSCAEGQVGRIVLKKLREASPSIYYELLDGFSEDKLPMKWTKNVRERT